MIAGTVVVHGNGPANVLAQCLMTIDEQLVDPGQLEVVVIRTATDHAARPASFDEWVDRAPGRRVLVVPDRRTARSFDLALDTARGDIVLFVDASALLPPTWARSHLLAHESRDAVGLVGGPVGVHWPADVRPPAGGTASGRCTGLDLGDDIVAFAPSQQPVRTNMSVRRAAAIEVGGFEAWLDLGGPDPLARDTFGLMDRLLEAGWEAVYDPGAAMIVQVTPERLDPSAQRRRSFADGVVRARVEVDRGRPSRTRRARRSASELRTAGRSWWRHRADGDAGPAVEHAGAGVELARLALRP